jgi:hypothetical protein
MLSNTKMTSLKKNNHSKVVGWCIAVLLLLNVCLFGADQLDELYNRCKNKSFGELQGEYNTVVGYHDDLRSKVILTMPKTVADLFSTEDDAWCEQRQVAWAKASATQDRQALWEIVLLEYLRCNAIKEKDLAGSP